MSLKLEIHPSGCWFKDFDSKILWANGANCDKPNCENCVTGAHSIVVPDIYSNGKDVVLTEKMLIDYIESVRNSPNRMLCQCVMCSWIRSRVAHSS